MEVPVIVKVTIRAPVEVMVELSAIGPAGMLVVMEVPELALPVDVEAVEVSSAELDVLEFD
jgi:hypothetical protein